MPILLAEHESAIRELPIRKQAFLLGNLFLYIFHGCRQADIRVALSEKKIDFDLLGWRRHLHTNGTLLRDGKLYAYATICKVKIDLSTLSLTESDIQLIKLALHYRPFSNHLKEYSSMSTCRALSARQFDKFVGAVLTDKDLISYTRKFIHKKMSFIMKSYNMDLYDIENTLRDRALYGLQRAYPLFEHLGHGIAIAKTLIKRSGINFIQEMTTQKQNALLQDKITGAYSKTTVSLDTIADGTGQFLTSDGTFIHRSLLVVGLSGLNTFENLSWDTQYSLEQVCYNRRLKPKQRQFVSLMLGKYHAEFSEFLGDSNDEVLESISYQSYTSKVCNFLGVPIQAGYQFLSNLKVHLGGSPDRPHAD